MAQKTLRNPNRRGLLLFACATGAVWGGGALVRRWRETQLSYVADPKVPGFRRVEGGEVSSGTGDPLIGLGGGGGAERTPAMGEICTWLYPGGGEGRVPVAYFWDYACPFCRSLSEDLRRLEEAGHIRLFWHHTPVFGPASERVARVLLAAEAQGAGPDMQTRVASGRLRPSLEGLLSLAEDLGLDGGRLRRDMQSEEVSERLARSRGLARTFAFPGTPSLVVGRTVVVGSISATRLETLVDQERRDTPGTLQESCG